MLFLNLAKHILDDRDSLHNDVIGIVMSNSRGYGFNPEQLVRIRKKRGLSQRDLAEKSGLARIGIARYEQGLAEPRMDSIQAIARELGVEPKVFFEWGSVQPGEQPEEPPLTPSGKAAERKSNSTDSLIQNLMLLSQVDLAGLLESLGSLKAFLDTLLATNNPLDYDQDLYDRELSELQRTTPNALPAARNELAWSIDDVSKATGLRPERLTEIETGRGIPVQASEIMALREALGVLYEPRAIAVRSHILFPPKDRRSARAKYYDSVHEWKTRCRRTPNKLDKLDILLNRVADQGHHQAKLEKRLEKLESDLRAYFGGKWKSSGTQES